MTLHFNFTEDQFLLQRTVRDFLESECPIEKVREFWQMETGRSPELWAKLAEIGVPGLLVPEAHGGLGMDEIDLVLILEETGYAALAEPVISTAAVGVPLVRDLDTEELGALWLDRVATGAAILAVGHEINSFVSDAHVADLLLLQHGDQVHALSPDQIQCKHQVANDPARRLFSVDWKPSSETCVARSERGQVLLAAALDRGALACAAQLLGVAQRLVELAVTYASERKQFGVPIGSFQALKHMLAEVQVKLEYARPLVYRAAHSVARESRCRSVDVSMAKVSASEAAGLAARVALQVQGALGYTWEQDLHVWMRRAWSLELAWGDGAWHRARVAAAVLDDAAPAETFGYSAPAT